MYDYRKLNGKIIFFLSIIDSDNLFFNGLEFAEAIWQKPGKLTLFLQFNLNRKSKLSKKVNKKIGLKDKIQINTDNDIVNNFVKPLAEKGENCENETDRIFAKEKKAFSFHLYYWTVCRNVWITPVKARSVPELIDPVFAKTNRKRSFWACFRKIFFMDSIYSTLVWLFPASDRLVLTSRLGTGISPTLFYRVRHPYTDANAEIAAYVLQKVQHR